MPYDQNCPIHPSPRRYPKSKSRSISSLPAPPRGLTMSTSHSPIPYVSKPRTSHSDPPKPTAMAIISPSRLPATDSLSYFPPFESMGSEPDMPEAGPSCHNAIRAKKPVRPSHTKGRSMGSIVGLVNSLGFLTRNATSPMEAPGLSRSTSDGMAVQALTKRVTPGKRRVLEPITIGNDMDSVQVQGISEIKVRKSESIKGRSPPKQSGGGVFSDSKASSLEDMDIDTPSRPDSRSSKRTNLHLPLSSLPTWRYPLPSPPVTSLSPHIPLELFCTEIDNPITSATNSPTKSSWAAGLARALLGDRESVVTPETEGLSPTGSYATLPDTTSPSSPSGPCTPDNFARQQKLEPRVQESPYSGLRRSFSTYPQGMDMNTYDHEDLASESGHSPSRHSYLGAKLSRTASSCSERSCDSKETIRPPQAEGEVTPKASRWMSGGEVFQ